MTTATILTDLAGITYSLTANTKAQRFQVWDEEFESFDLFPLIVVESGPEEDEPLVNLGSLVTFHPAIHLFAEDDTAANMEAWRDDIRNAVMNNATLRNDVISVAVESVAVSLSENRKLQHLRLQLNITFEITHT